MKQKKQTGTIRKEMGDVYHVLIGVIILMMR